MEAAVAPPGRWDGSRVGPGVNHARIQANRGPQPGARQLPQPAGARAGGQRPAPPAPAPAPACLAGNPGTPPGTSGDGLISRHPLYTFQTGLQRPVPASHRWVPPRAAPSPPAEPDSGAGPPMNPHPSGGPSSPPGVTGSSQIRRGGEKNGLILLHDRRPGLPWLNIQWHASRRAKPLSSNGLHLNRPPRGEATRGSPRLGAGPSPAPPLGRLVMVTRARASHQGHPST